MGVRSNRLARSGAMENAVIVSGARTPMGRFGGSFKDVSAPELGAAAIKAALERAGVSPHMVEEVVLGNALQAQEAGYAARLASLNSGTAQERWISSSPAAQRT